VVIRCRSGSDLLQSTILIYLINLLERLLNATSRQYEHKTSALTPVTYQQDIEFCCHCTLVPERYKIKSGIRTRKIMTGCTKLVICTYGIISNFGIKLLRLSFQPVLRIHVRFLWIRIQPKISMRIKSMVAVDPVNQSWRKFVEHFFGTGISRISYLDEL
jgi:hypothetical protein